MQLIANFLGKLQVFISESHTFAYPSWLLQSSSSLDSFHYTNEDEAKSETLHRGKDGVDFLLESLRLPNAGMMCKATLAQAGYMAGLRQ